MMNGPKFSPTPSFKLFLFLLFPIALGSCKTKSFYQVNEVRNEDQDERMVFENEDLRVEYFLWGEGGNYYFKIKNKNPKSYIWIDSKNSNIVQNGEAASYYDKISIVKKYKKRKRELGEDVIISEREVEVKKGEQRYISLPPESEKLFNQGQISEEPLPALDVDSINTDSLNRYDLTFDKTNSPLKVRNFIYYYKDKDHDKSYVLKNSFYLAEVDLVNEKERKFAQNKYYYHKSETTATFFGAFAGLVGVVGGSAGLIALIAVALS